MPVVVRPVSNSCNLNRKCSAVNMSLNTGIKVTSATHHIEGDVKDPLGIQIDHAVDEENQPQYDDKETKKILRKVDYRLMPILTYLYLVSYIDRGNVGNARVAGMNDDLGLSGAQFNFVLTVNDGRLVKKVTSTDCYRCFSYPMYFLRCRATLFSN